MSITVAARRDFVEGITRLSLWLAREDAKCGRDLGEGLTARTPLYRLTTLWDGIRHPAESPAGWRDATWEGLLEELGGLLRRHWDDSDSAAFEEEGLTLLWKMLEPRISRDVAEWPYLPCTLGVRRPDARTSGFFVYYAGDLEEGRRALDLHMGNSLAPASPFSDQRARGQELLSLLDDAVACRPGLHHVSSCSWLNSFAPFLELFPPEWSADASGPSALGFRYDWWGQFITRTGGFHRRNAERLQLTGEFPYPSVTCRCSIASLRLHIKEMFVRRRQG